MDSFKRNVVVIAAALTVLWSVSLSAAEGPETPVVRIRILDYAQIPNEAIARAQERVTDIYSAIGVHAQWQRTVRPLETSRGRATVPDARELFVIVVTPDMSRRQNVAPDVVGAAIVSPLDGGRVAYVLFDRIALVAKASGSSTTDIMGVVIAHEVGHLMLPHGSHSNGGLMRANWNVRELRRTSRPEFAFTSGQGEIIRHRLQRWVPLPSINATQ